VLIGEKDVRDPGFWNDAPGFEEKFFIVESEHCS
jgi:hypothetical protein